MKNLILFFGEEKLLIDEAIANLKNKTIPQGLQAINFISFDGKNAKEEDILDACDTVPMMSEKKIVVVYDASFFKNEGKMSSERQKWFLDRLKRVPAHTYLIFTTSQVDKRSKIFKFFQANGVAYEYKPLLQKDKAFWIQKRAKLYNKSIDLRTAYFIAEYTTDLYQADNELKKIASFVGERVKIEQNDLDEIFSKSLEGNIFEMMDYIGSKRPAEAIKSLNYLMERGEKGAVILYMISKHIMNLLTVKSMKGIEREMIQKKTGMHPFVLKKAISQAENFSAEELEKALKLCQEIDIAIKTGKIDEKIGIELLAAKTAI
ncbi:DNA polymerase III subunit delta [Tepidanaerobacter syntrophicus]|uniref:DNA polymerase III subunit delta n=1 Tax=Tepidanaerobacter syntrophicus TaxID=224999 RepID=UPI0022EE6929|nr:DNA polymerase III subunit delta [Tepidanaerobacter syntrophicus]GLI49984.1 DNA polymerase III subunit delta [Tepidanaerobacter syntrophicus]